jgi:hypothetical protein
MAQGHLQPALFPAACELRLQENIQRNVGKTFREKSYFMTCQIIGIQNAVFLPGMVVYAYNPHTWEAEA